MGYKELIERLKRLDEDASLLYDDNNRFRLVIVGGGALILLEAIDRATLDIDALSISRELTPLLERYDINAQVAAYINNFPYNYEDRLHKLDIGSKKIDFYTASLEDIVIAKLCSYRDTDRQDVINPEVIKSLDWKLLEKLATDEDELKANISDRGYSEFLYNYEEYVRRYRP